MKGMSMADFRDLNRQRGFHSFKSSTMRFFRSKLSNWDFDTGYFISSEKSPHDERRYTLRKADFETGNVLTVGEFYEYKNLYLARQALIKKVTETKNESIKN